MSPIGGSPDRLRPGGDPPGRDRGAATRLRSLARRAGRPVAVAYLRRRLAADRSFVLPLTTVLRLLYPEPFPTDLDLERAALSAAGSPVVRDLGTVRRILADLDGPSGGSPVLVRFGAADVEVVDVAGVSLALDRADTAVSGVIVAEGTYEPEITGLLARFLRPGMTFVDVGANVGYHALLAARAVGPTGRVVAVEPSSENCRLILLSAALNGFANVEVLPVALDDHQGWAHLSHHIGSNASFVPGGVEDLRRGHGTVVPVLRLDQLVSGRVDVVKLDVEGAEAHAVAGGASLIAASLPVVVTEVSAEMLQRVSGCSVRDYLGFFERLGYTAALVRPGRPEPEPIGDLDAFAGSWVDPFRIENLVLTPPPGSPGA